MPRRLVRRVLPLVALSFLAPAALASHTAPPASVNLVGSLQSEATGGACGDWDPGCAASAFAPQPNGVFLFESAVLPNDSWEYKIALGSWAENYGSNFQQDGPNIVLNLPTARSVRFYYDHKTHYIADNVRNTIYTVPGSYGPAIGCGEWAPACLGSLMSDVDGNGIFTFTTSAIPPGSYFFKVATNESWSNPNYGIGGGAADVPFTVPAAASTVVFAFDSATNVPSVNVTAPAAAPDNNVEWNGLRHDSRDLLYRTPGGAVEEGTAVRLRFRTFHDDVTAVAVRLYDVNASAQSIRPMTLAASGVPCYQPGLAGACDFWELELENEQANNLWYRFIVSDGTDVDYYADDTAALDGGRGATSDDPIDRSYALTVYESGFETPDWAKSAVIYQIFPDRFRNGNLANDPAVPDSKKKKDQIPRYGFPPAENDKIVKLDWDDLPEGYCRNYATPLEQCQERFPQDDGDPREGPRGRDYFGGDLQGVIDKLDYLADLGVTAIYFNPVFDGASNHGYDTQDYTRIDPFFGDLATFQALDAEAEARGIRLIVDGVFNHVSSDSPFFDRYGHFETRGACEFTNSPYVSWFEFREDTGDEQPDCRGDRTYDGWFGFDSIPVLTKTNPDVRAYFLDSDGIAARWLREGADGWRLDVSGDASFPAGYWEQFRNTVKAVDEDALTISETWQKDTALLRILRGDRLDTTMNYRLRDALLGLLAPQGFDSKGFGDSGAQKPVSTFASRLLSIYEDTPPEAAATFMNLLGSHDTERILWTLTPGAETPAAKELNVAEGKQRLELATLLQFAAPGAPTVYYGDEVGVTGDDDPDDRRTYPWEDLGGDPDEAMLSHFQALAEARRELPALTEGALSLVHVSDADETVAIARTTDTQRVFAVVNRSDATRTVDLGAYVRGAPEIVLEVGTTLLGSPVVTLSPRSGALVVSNGDFAPPAAPTGLAAIEGNASVELSWSGSGPFNVYRSPLSGGGFVKVNASPLAGTTFTDTGLENARRYFYVVRTLDPAGNESADSNEVEALPHLTIGWAKLQWPPTLTHTVSTSDRTDNVYGQVWIGGATEAAGPTPGLIAQLGFGPDGSDPVAGGWTWEEATFNVQAGNNDEFVASLLPEAVGTFEYAYRYSTTGGRDWVYADLNGPFSGTPGNPGSLSVLSSGDTTAPATPTGLNVVSASPAGIELAWNAVADAALYEVRRDGEKLVRVTGTSYTDTSVVQGVAYTYAVVAIDASFNRSAPSAPATATAELRTVQLTFNVTVPAPVEDAVGKSVYIAGFLDRLDGTLPQWDPAGVVLTKVGDTQWTITLTGKESTQLEYKYTLGSWDFVEKDGACGEIGNRQLTLSYGTTGAQVVNDTVLNWRNVASCGN